MDRSGTFLGCLLGTRRTCDVRDGIHAQRLTGKSASSSIYAMLRFAPGDVESYMASMRDKKQVAYYTPPLAKTVSFLQIGGWC